MGAILAGLKVAGAFLSGLFGTLFKWAGMIGAYFLGRRRVQMEIAEDAAETKDKQLEVAARPPRSKSAIVKRMLDGEL